MRFIVFFILLFSTNSWAGKLDCLQNDPRYAMDTIGDGSYNFEDPMADVYFSLKGKGRYLLLNTKGPHWAWPDYSDGVSMVLTRKGTKFFSSQGDIVLHPFCNTQEIYLEFVGSRIGGIFMGQSL